MSRGMHRKHLPPLLTFGPAVTLINVNRLAAQLSLGPDGTPVPYPVAHQSARALLQALAVPLIYLGADTYYNQDALEEALHFVTRFGGPGFIAPGSAGLSRRAEGKTVSGLTRLTEADLKAGHQAARRSLMAAARRRTLPPRRSPFLPPKRKGPTITPPVIPDILLRQLVPPDLSHLGGTEKGAPPSPP